MSTTNSVMVATPRTVYVLVASRQDFERIELPVLASEKVLVKAMDNGCGVTVYFQHWLA